VSTGRWSSVRLKQEVGRRHRKKDQVEGHAAEVMLSEEAMHTTVEGVLSQLPLGLKHGLGESNLPAQPS
jgi:hypothetical protein